MHHVFVYVSAFAFIITHVFIINQREDLAKSCQTCNEVFGITKQKHFCHVCGIAVCKACSSNDLIIYIPDGEKEEQENWPPKLAIIKIIGVQYFWDVAGRKVMDVGMSDNIWFVLSRMLKIVDVIKWTDA